MKRVSKEPQAADHLRRTAAQYRRLAGIPTSGGHRADRVLLELADRLDREAAAERQGADTYRSDD